MNISRLFVSLFFSLFLCAMGFGQTAEGKRFSVDVSGGIANADFYDLSPTTGLHLQFRPTSRWIVGVTGELYGYDVLIGNSSATGGIAFNFRNGYSFGVYSGFDLIRKSRFRLSAMAGPTLSQSNVEETTTIRVGGATSITKRDFRTNASIGLGLWVRGEYDFTDRWFGVAQLSGHEDLGEEISRFALRVGGGIRF